MEEEASKHLRNLGPIMIAKTFEVITRESGRCPQSEVEEVIAGNLHPGMHAAMIEGAEGEEGEVDVEETVRAIGPCRVRGKRHGIDIDCRYSLYEPPRTEF